jgi:hypothetical protein
MLSALDQHGWRLPSNQSDEFPIWLGEVDEWIPPSSIFLERLRQMTPADAAELLSKERANKIELMDAWRSLCEEKPPRAAFAIMDAMVVKGVFDPEVWRMAFSVFWGRIPRGWEVGTSPFLLSLLASLPDDLVSKINNTASGWLETLARNLPTEDGLSFWQTWDRLWSLSSSEEVGGISEQPLHAALNHSSGQLTEAALNLLFRDKRSRDEGLPDEFRSRFNKIATDDTSRGTLGRVILCSRLNNLYLLDGAWTLEQLLPRLDWSTEFEAGSMWRGYLWAPQCSLELFAAFKKNFLETVERSQEFGEQATNLRRLFTEICVYADGELTKQEITKTVHKFDASGLADVLLMISDLLRGAGEKSSSLWNERIRPRLLANWPANREKQNERTSSAVAEMVLNSGEAFEAVMDWAEPYLMPVHQPDRIIWRLNETQIAENHPDGALRLLFKVVSGDALSWTLHELGDVLKRIAAAEPSVTASTQYKRLNTLALRST